MKFPLIATFLLAFPAVVSAASPEGIEVTMLDIDDIASNHQIVIDSSDLSTA